ERPGERGDLVLVDGNLERDRVRQLREPAEVADDERAAERQYADRAPGRLPHRRRAERDARVARRHQRPELLLVDVVDALDAVTYEPLRVVARGRRADEQEPRVRMAPADCGKRLEQLWYAFARVDVTEAAEQRSPLDVGRNDIGHRPGRMRDPPDRPVVR